MASNQEQSKPELTPQAKQLDEQFNELVETCKDLHDDAYGSMSETLWMNRLTKLQAAYIKSKNPMGWAPMFLNFYALHSEVLSKPIFHEVDDEDKVNDEWLKDMENREGGSSAPPSSRTGWGPKTATCRGHVIYFNPNPKYRAVSFALGEIYEVACDLSKKKGTKDVKKFAYPAKILYHLYAIWECVLSKEDPTWKQVSSNALVLKTFLDEVLPSDGQEGLGSGIKGFSKIMASVMKNAGISSEVNTGELEKAMESTFQGDTVQTMGKVVSKIMSSITSGEEGKEGTESPDQVMDRLGDVFKDKEIREMLSSSAQETAGKMADLAESVPTAENVSDVLSSVAGKVAGDGGDGKDGGDEPQSLPLPASGDGVPSASVAPSAAPVPASMPLAEDPSEQE